MVPNNWARCCVQMWPSWHKRKPSQTARRGDSGSPRFPAESFERRRILRYTVRQKFEGDESPQRQVFGFVNHAHSAAKLFHDAVVRNGLADHPTEILGPKVVQVKERFGQTGLPVSC